MRGLCWLKNQTAHPQTTQDAWESSGSIVWDCEPACPSLACPWPCANNINPFFLHLLFVCKAWWANEGHIDVSLLPNVLKSQGLFPFLLTERSGLVFKGKKPFSSFCSFSFFTSYSETQLAKKSNFTLSVPERINTVKLHWISTATFFSLALFQTHNLGVNMQLK